MGKALCVEAEDISVSSTQFCYEHKTAPKKFKKQKTPSGVRIELMQFMEFICHKI